MMNLFKKIQKQARTFTLNQWSLILVSAGLFLPFQYAAALLGLVLVWTCWKGRLFEAVKSQTGAPFLYAFVFLEIVVSLFYQNWIGLLNALGFLGAALYIAWFRKNLTMPVFQSILELMILMSWLAAFWGLVEFQRISARQGYSFFDFVILNKPEDRINSTFKNANFYATMCDFFIMFCLYEYVNVKRIGNRIYYVLTALLNFFMLLLTGCRTALLPFAVIFPLFFWFARKKALFGISCAAEVGAVALVLVKPSLIPRIDNMSTLFSRIKIWDGAWQMFQMHPLFGMGPQTYGFLSGTLNFQSAPHAHNLVLDSLTSFGLVGTALGLAYLFCLFREAMRAYGRNRYSSQFSLIVCFGITALILGMLDVTLNFPVTGITFMMVVNSACLFRSGNLKTNRIQ